MSNYGLAKALYGNVDHYDYAYDILVRKVRPSVWVRDITSDMFSGIDINKWADKKSYYYLEKAIRSEQFDMACLLLKYGADPNIYDYTLTPLERLIGGSSNESRLAYLLIKAGAETEGLEHNLIEYAIKNSDILFLQELLAKYDCSTACIEKEEFIQRAIVQSNPDMKNFLLSLGVKINLDDGVLLKGALQKGDVDSLKHLKEIGATCGGRADELFMASVDSGVQQEFLKHFSFSTEDIVRMLPKVLKNSSFEAFISFCDQEDIADMCKAQGP